MFGIPTAGWIHNFAPKENMMSDNPLTFNFAVKEDSNSAPEIKFIPDFMLTKGKEFTYQLNGSDPDKDEIKYFSNDSEINVNEITGFVSFTPNQAEEKIVEFCVVDKLNKTGCRTSKLMVQDE